MMMYIRKGKVVGVLYVMIVAECKGSDHYVAFVRLPV
jgi:hypothetical protein